MPKYFDFEVSLLGIEPRIWRRFLLAQSASFEALHEAIQDSFGWDYDHLFAFREKDGRQTIARAPFDDPYGEEDVPVVGKLKLASFFTKNSKKCRYVYDFGDNWEHAVEFVGVVDLSEKFKRRLLDGARASPLEDCGGVFGYEECVQVVGMSDKDIEKAGEDGEWLTERREWVGDWNPEDFDFLSAKREFDE